MMAQPWTCSKLPISPTNAHLNCAHGLRDKRPSLILSGSRTILPSPGTSSTRSAPGRPGRRRQGLKCQASSELAGSALQQLSNPLVRDCCATVAATAGALVLVKLAEILTYKGIIDQKLSRKLVHICAGPGFALCWPLFSSEPTARFFAVIVPSLNLLRVLLLGFGVIDDEKTVRSMSREGDRSELLRGPLYYVLVLMAATVLYWRDSPVGVVAMSLMCGGDGLADVVGRRLGQGNRLPWNPAKSWAGSAAMLLGGSGLAISFVALFCALGYFDCDMGAMAAYIGTIALIATAIESLPVNNKLDDNISVPGAVALMGFLLRSAMVAL